MTDRKYQRAKTAVCRSTGAPVAVAAFADLAAGRNARGVTVFDE